jgi:hypothetical protein
MYDRFEGCLHLLLLHLFPLNIGKPGMLLDLVDAVGSQSSLRVTQEKLNSPDHTLLMKSMEWGDHL